jgi:hypothetical protein
MADVILHHYWESPYAEKIRRILGYKGIAWRSVIIPTGLGRRRAVDEALEILEPEEIVLVLGRCRGLEGDVRRLDHAGRRRRSRHAAPIRDGQVRGAGPVKGSYARRGRAGA